LILTLDREEDERDYMIAIITLLVCCLLANMFIALVACKYLVPNFWRERGLAAIGQSMGNLTTSLLFIRSSDKHNMTPVLISAMHAQILHGILNSGGLWTLSVVTIVNETSVYVVPSISFTLLIGWIVVWRFHLRHYYPSSYWETIGDPTHGGNTIVTLQESHRLSGGGSLQTPLMESAAIEGVEVQILECGVNLDWDTAILTNRDNLGRVCHSLPRRCRDKDWRILYSMELHGASLGALYRQCTLASGPCVIMCMDTWSYIFGAFVNTPPRMNMLGEPSYGNGECFLFTFEPEFKIYKWSRDNDIFMNGMRNAFSIGGGGDGAGFRVDAGLLNGVSNKSATFQNQKTIASSTAFKMLHLEVWSVGKVKGDTESIIGDQRENLAGGVTLQEMRTRSTIENRDLPSRQARRNTASAGL